MCLEKGQREGSGLAYTGFGEGHPEQEGGSAQAGMGLSTLGAMEWWVVWLKENHKARAITLVSCIWQEGSIVGDLWGRVGTKGLWRDFLAVEPSCGSCMWRADIMHSDTNHRWHPWGSWTSPVWGLRSQGPWLTLFSCLDLFLNLQCLVKSKQTTSLRGSGLALETWEGLNCPRGHTVERPSLKNASL